MNNEKLLDEAKKLNAELQLVIESMQRDLGKNLSKNNTAAGRRVRSSLRILKTKATELIRLLVTLDKERK